MLQNDFEQYHASVKLYQTAINTSLSTYGSSDQNTICKVNAMFNLVSLQIDHDHNHQQHSNRSQRIYVIQAPQVTMYHT